MGVESGGPIPEELGIRQGESPLREKDIEKAHQAANDSEAYRFLAKSAETDPDLTEEERQERKDDYMDKATNAEWTSSDR